MLCIGIDRDGETKVDEFDAEGKRVDEDIFRFDVSVHNPALVHVGYGVAHLESDVGDLIVGEVAVLVLLHIFIECYKIRWQVLKH